MSFSSALNLGGLRSGICTSTSKPASPFDGQIIYMTDVDQAAVWDGSAWVGMDPSRDRNVIINGAMQVAQRGTSTASITTDGFYTADRWAIQLGSLGTWTQSVETDGPTGSGLRKSLKMLCTTADASPAAGDALTVVTRLEGQNLQQFLKGTASARQFSVSFWVKSNVTGTYIVELYDVDNSRQVSASYSVSASGTWEKKTITFPADTTGALDNDNARSLDMLFWVGAGTTFTSGTLNTTWGSITQANRAAGLTNLAANTNNYWQITGVQLEAGAVATPFEFEDYGVTLAKCQRYFFSLVSTTDSRDTTTGINAYYFSATDMRGQVAFPVTMRSAPTLSTTTSGNGFYFNSASVPDYFTTLTLLGASSRSAEVRNNTEMGGTAGQAGGIWANGTSCTITFSAEL